MLVVPFAGHARLLGGLRQQATTLATQLVILRWYRDGTGPLRNPERALRQGLWSGSGIDSYARGCLGNRDGTQSAGVGSHPTSRRSRPHELDEQGTPFSCPCRSRFGIRPGCFSLHNTGFSRSTGLDCRKRKSNPWNCHADELWFWSSLAPPPRRQFGGVPAAIVGTQADRTVDTTDQRSGFDCDRITDTFSKTGLIACLFCVVLSLYFRIFV